ncbi:hypothetical protein IAI10_23055 [Clostridium sp. 19966]|uniref:ArdC family protein n=1 Tax=Clostridium sp. 19966 TaxID=2768166 RepID=UPI0028DE491D|nr:ArdC family protein [Clostridium sp. 19966]MDT8719528.1 hypothetical protein [Clostridium sp. 19966]
MKNINVDEIIKHFQEKLNNGKSENLLNYLKFISNFHNYSFNNTILIYSQMPTASFCASFVNWRSKGYVVKRGEKGIRILVPKIAKFVIDDNGEKIFFSQMTQEQREKVDKYYTLTTFTEGCVFDISQTEKVKGSKEDDMFFKPLGNDFEEQYVTLKSIVESKGIEVKEENTGSAEGISLGGKISIKKDLDYNNKTLVLIHEFSHEILDQDIYNEVQESDRQETNSSIRELRAESCSYIVSSYLGLDNPFSADYVLHWSNKEEFIKNLETIKKASSHIISLLEEYNTNKLDNSNVAV